MSVLTANAIPFTPVSNSSSVSASGTVTSADSGTLTYSDSHDYGEASGVVGITIPGMGPFLWNTTSRSTLELAITDGIKASGGVSVSAAPTSPWAPVHSMAMASSVFDMVFTLTEQVHYTLSGLIAYREGSSVRLILSMLDGPSLVEARDPGGHWGGPYWESSFNLTGILSPGDYHLMALADGIATGGYATSNPSSAGFSFALDFTSQIQAAQVPDAGSTLWLALPLSGLMMVAWRKQRSKG